MKILICDSPFHSRRRGLVAAINETTRARGFVSAVNASPFDPASEWITLRYGVYPNVRGLQVFDRAGAEQMVQTFNSLLDRAADGFKGLPIYVGHPDDPEWAAANPGVPAAAVGRLKAMEAAPEGLRLKRALNDDGKRLLSGDAAPYDSYSPNWGMIPTTHKGRKAFQPVELYSIGLTNRPNIPRTYIGLNEALPAETTPENLPMNKLLIALLAAIGRPIANATAVNDEQLTVAVNEAIAAAPAILGAVNELATTKTKLGTAEQSLATANTALQTATNESAGLRTSLATERSARAETLVVAAINEGRVTLAQKPEWLGKFTAAGADFAAVSADLAKITKAINTKATAKVGDRRGAPSSPEVKQRIGAMNEAIEKKMTEARCDRVTAYNTLREEKPELFAATNAS